jgi:histone arginine demethylase JMJD6
MKQLERRGKLSKRAFLRDYGLTGKPVILTEATQGWKALEWTPEMLSAHYGDMEVELTPSASLEEATTSMLWSEYVEYLKSPDERLLYLTSLNFREYCPELLDDFQVPIYFREDWLQEIDPAQQFDLLWLFLGPGGAGFRLHVDLALTSAWNVQVTGKKKWLLFPPEQGELLYNGEVDAFEPDLERFPLFAEAQGYECTISPGELIFTPSGWWHQTKTLETGFAITSNFANSTNYHLVQDWLHNVGVHLQLEHDMEAYAREFDRVVQAHLG